MKPTLVPAPGAEQTAAIRSRVEAVIGRFLEEQELALGAADPVAAGLVSELRRLFAAGGKRLRPLFCYWGFRACGGVDGDEIVRAAASLEMLHTFAIVHDDIMDRSALRRGVPASHVAMARDGDAHSGVSAAILAGDLALVLADELFGGAGFRPERTLAGHRWYNRMRTEVVAGQYLDLLASRGAVPDEGTVLRIARLKSGGYTVEKPLLIGGALAGASPEAEAAFSAFGVQLGEAFQLRDDVLGVFGDPALTGKGADGDLREGKRTLLVSRALAAAGAKDRRLIEDRLGAEDLTNEDAERIRAIMRSSGALDSTLETIERSRVAAVEALAPHRFLDEIAVAALVELADLATVRES